ncbi:MAG TPA: ABC transporter substrate-binding protein [Sporichthyaceae bacterium]|nr:ABC transporter substrate-binding protein [Sporichthyaceae bacterium]
MRIHVRRLSVLLCTGLLLTACGPRISDSEIASAAGGGPATLAPTALNQVRAAAQAGAAAGAPAAGSAAAPAQAGAAAPAGATGTAPVSTGTTSTKPGAAPASTSTTTAAGPAKAAAAATKPEAGAAAAAKPAAAGPACTKAGTPVAVGQVGTFSGVTGPAWSGGRTSVAVWAKDINARGGLACHPVQLFFGDDGGDPARASALIAQFAHDDHVVAFIGGHDDFSMAGFKQGVETAKVPAVGGDVIAPEWYGSSEYLFPQGASVDDQVVGLLKQAVGLGKTKVGLLYCVEVKACTYLNQQAPALAKVANAQIVYTSAISLTQTDFTAQCQSAKSAGADQLALGMDGTAMARVARSCKAIGYQPLLTGIGGTLSPGQAKDPTLREFNLGTASGNAPWTESSTPGLKAYQDALVKYAPGEEPSGSSVQMWAAAKLLEAAVGKLGAAGVSDTLTPAMVLDGLHKIHNDTLDGLSGPLTFNSGGLAKSNGCVFFELLTQKGWTAPQGSKAICR